MSSSQNSLGEAGICILNLITRPHCSVSMALGRRGAVRPGASTFDSPWSLLPSDSLFASGKLGLEPWLQFLCSWLNIPFLRACMTLEAAEDSFGKKEKSALTSCIQKHRIAPDI